ncbi:MAG: hypothetical protein II773_03320 [Oscillospiraceae bacterium]|nr:hypothetical protein [Oscillospiraceae bacterium]
MNKNRIRPQILMTAAIISITAVFSGCGSKTAPAAETTTAAQQTSEAASESTAAETQKDPAAAIVGNYDCVGVLDEDGYAVSVGDGEYLRIKEDGTGVMFFAVDAQDEDFPVTWTYENGIFSVYDPADETEEPMQGTFENGIIKLKIAAYYMVLAVDTSDEWKAWKADKDKFDEDFLDGKYCGAKKYPMDEDTTETEETTSESGDVTENDLKKDDKTAFDPFSAYEDVLRDIAVQIADEDPSHVTDNWIFENIVYNSPAGDNSGYLYYDINKDGIEELIVCGIKGYDDNIYGIYTYKDGEVVHIAEGWSRSSLGITADGKIIVSGSAGAASSCFGVFHINESNDGMECEHFWFTDPIDGDFSKVGTYYNTTGVWDVEQSEMIEEDANDYYHIRDDYKLMTLDPTPFTRLVDEVSHMIAHITVERSENISKPMYYNEFNTGISAEEGVNITLFSDTIADVILLSLKNTEFYETYDAMELFEAQISPETPILATIQFPGDTPAYGIEVTDDTGTRFYSIDMSGEDGSLYLTRIEVENVDHSRG